jgi:hypothetical protein
LATLIKVYNIDFDVLTVLVLMFQGFRKVYNIFGGIHAYAEQVNPSVPTYKRENFGDRTPFNILAGHPFKTVNFYLRGKESNARK